MSLLGAKKTRLWSPRTNPIVILNVADDCYSFST